MFVHICAFKHVWRHTCVPVRCCSLERQPSMVALRNTTDVQMFLFGKQTKQRLFFSGPRDCQNTSRGPFRPLASTDGVTMCSTRLGLLRCTESGFGCSVFYGCTFFSDYLLLFWSPEVGLCGEKQPDPATFTCDLHPAPRRVHPGPAGPRWAPGEDLSQTGMK